MKYTIKQTGTEFEFSRDDVWSTAVVGDTTYSVREKVLTPGILCAMHVRVERGGELVLEKIGATCAEPTMADPTGIAHLIYFLHADKDVEIPGLGEVEQDVEYLDVEEVQ